MEEAKIKEKLEGNQNNSHILSHTYTTQKKKLYTYYTQTSHQPDKRQRKSKKLAKDDHRSPIQPWIIHHCQ
jgi:hypothetical protein